MLPKIFFKLSPKISAADPDIAPDPDPPLPEPETGLQHYRSKVKVLICLACKECTFFKEIQIALQLLQD
jgi:hypothetical protein